MQHILKQSFRENLNFGPMKKPPMDHVLLDDLPDSICKLQSNASCTSFRRLQKDLHMVAKILTGREHLHSQAGSSKAALIRTRDIPHWEYLLIFSGSPFPDAWRDWSRHKERSNCWGSSGSSWCDVDVKEHVDDPSSSSSSSSESLLPLF